MKIYTYNPSTFEYAQTRDARQDPVVAGNFLVPAFATIITPPETGEKEVALFNPKDKVWSIEPDYRSVEVWLKKDSSESGVVEFIGKLPNHLTDKKPPVEEGKKAAWTTNGWVLKEDHTGSSVWEKETALQAEVKDLGPLQDSLTKDSPEGFEFPVWSGTAWEEDLDKARSIQKELIKEAADNLTTSTTVFVQGNEFSIESTYITALLLDIQVSEMVGVAVETETVVGEWVEFSVTEAKELLLSISIKSKEVRSKAAKALCTIDASSTLSQIKEVSI